MIGPKTTPPAHPNSPLGSRPRLHSPRRNPHSPAEIDLSLDIHLRTVPVVVPFRMNFGSCAVFGGLCGFSAAFSHLFRHRYEVARWRAKSLKINTCASVTKHATLSLAK